MLFERFDVDRPTPMGNRNILVIGGAGGVGSIAVQLAKHIAGMTVIATASRPETADFARRMGADLIVDHSKPLVAEIRAAGALAPAFVFGTTETDRHFDQIVELIAPQGSLGVISGIGASDTNKLSAKSVALCYELMFTRSIFMTPDIAEQHRILDEVAEHVDTGKLKTTRTEHFGTINAANLMKAHALIESGKAIGKVVLEGF